MTPPLTENILAVISDVLLPKFTSGDLRIPATHKLSEATK